MTIPTLARLVRARYLLQWASVRRSPLNIAFFMLAQGVLLLVVLVVASGALLGAAVAVRTGQTEGAARTILGAVFLNALIASVVLGLGMNQVFSDAMLRRYPLSRRERLVAAQLLALFEPLWLISIALYLGAAIGFWALGSAPLWLAAGGALMLVCANYLLARVVLAVIDRAMAIRSGQFTLFVLLNLFAFGPMVGTAFVRTPAVAERATILFAATPPFVAAAMLSGHADWWHPLLLAGWIAAGGAALLYLESRPQPARSRATGAAAGSVLWDRLAAALPLPHPPLVAKTVRYFFRNPRVRWNLVAGIVIGAFLLSGPAAGGPDAGPALVTAVLLSAFVGVLPALELDANLFGFEGRGFRRLLLAPVALGSALQSISLTSLLVSVLYAFVAIGIWSVAFAFEPRVLGLMCCSAVTGVLLLKGAGIWGSVLLPRAGEYGALFKNQSGAGQWLVIGAGFIIGFGALAGRFWLRNENVIEYWWAASFAAVVSAAVYAICLVLGGRVLERRRETVLEILERRK